VIGQRFPERRACFAACNIGGEIRVLGDEITLSWLGDLPQDQRVAIQARVLDERSYPDIAGELGTSEAAVRMRVSRGLAALRTRIARSR